jgi:hypothetical protein
LELKKHIIINLFAGPGSGKSTTASNIFKYFKKNGYNCELASEVAKDLTYSKSRAINNQFFVSASQYQEIFKVLDYWDSIGKKGILIMDSPIIIGLAFYEFYTGIFDKSLKDILFSKFLPELNKDFIFKNINIFLNNSNINYDPVGRNETELEASNINFMIKNLLKNNKIPYKNIDSTHSKSINKYCLKKVKKLLK